MGGRALSQLAGEQPCIAALALQQHILHLQVACAVPAQASWEAAASKPYKPKMMLMTW